MVDLKAQGRYGKGEREKGPLDQGQLAGLKSSIKKSLSVTVPVSLSLGAAAFIVTAANAPEEGVLRAAIVNGVLIGLLAVIITGAAAAVFAYRLWSAAERLRSLLKRAIAGDADSDKPVEKGDGFWLLSPESIDLVSSVGEVARNYRLQQEALDAMKVAVEGAGDAVAIIYGGSRGNYANARFSELYGYTAKELGDDFVRDAPLLDPAQAREAVEALGRGERWEGEVVAHARGGGALPVLLRTFPIKDWTGRATGRLEIHTDLMGRRRSEMFQSALFRIAELTDGAEDVESFYSSLHSIVGQLMSASNFFIAAYDPQTQTVSFPYFIDEEDTTPAPRKLKKGLTEYVLRTGKPLLAPCSEIEQIIRRGEIEVVGTLPVDWLGVPLKLGDETMGVLAVQSYREEVRFCEADKEVLTFVSQHIASALNRKRAAQRLRVSEEKYRTILESIEDGYFEVDLAGDLVFFNDPVCDILGYPAAELVGLNNRQYTAPEWSKEVFSEFNKVFRTGVPVKEFSYQVLRKDGARRFVETSVSLKKNSKGEAEGFRGIIRDVTERREAEALLERNLKEFLTIVSNVSEGDLTRRGADGDDTLGRVVESVNKMLDQFSSMLTEVKQIGLSVSSSATEILAAAEQIAVGAQRQADEITNTSSAVEEMAASMNQVSRNAEASADAARRALELAENGDRAVVDTTEAMGRINSAVRQTSEKMRLLGARSSEISEIIDLINEIASQTNLLALNAAIEAAHAGEAGLGFSVVAEEIRKLAERSSRATRDVGSLIKAIQQETNEAISAMEVGMSEVKGGSLLASQASGALRDISEAVRQSTELIEEISAASDEQARVTRNLAGAMQTISSITLETSAGAHQTAQTIQGMVALSEQLNSAISQFKVKDNFIHPFSYDGPGAPSSAGTSGAGYARYQRGD